MSLHNYISDILIKKPLSDDDIKNNNIKNIILYKDLYGKNLSKLFGKYNHIIILYPTINTSDGHWTLLYLHNGMIRYFDSYGKPADYWIHKLKLPIEPVLENLNLPYNDYQYQKNGDVSTCGRWCILRAKFSKLTDEQFKRTFSKKITLTPDEMVSLII
jgi:hypothetical protein